MRKALLIPFVASALLGCAPSDSTPGGTGGAASGGSTTPGTGGAASGGSTTPGTGGAASGGSTTPGTGGAASGGSTTPGTGGAASGGSTTPGTGGRGTGGANTGGTGPGTGGSGTGGRGTGGSASGGAGTGTGGAATGGAAGGSTGAGTAPIDGFEYLLPCGANQSYSDLVCINGNGCAGNGDQGYLNAGKLNMNMKTKYTGATGMLSVHVQGIVEPKKYNGCTTFFGKPQEGWAYGPANGSATTGGCYPNTSGNYNVYMLQVGANTGGVRYFLNAINQTEAHFSYKIDYTFTMPIKNGDDLWFLAADSNCSAIRNCDNQSIDASGGQGKCNALQVTGLQAVPAINQPYNGQFIVLHATLM